MTGATLARHLGCPVAPLSHGRGVRRIAASRSASWLLARSLRHLDRVGAAVLRGGPAATEILAGLPVVVLTTTGARSGRPHAVRLVPVVTEDLFAVLGTNFGEARAPAWAANLRARPEAVVEFRGRRVNVRATELDGRRRDEALGAAVRLYPGFGRYLIRASGRRVHVFTLAT
jgi:deazaflavin-dependent oxidoreductase (nitroreductase family)